MYLTLMSTRYNLLSIFFIFIFYMYINHLKTRSINIGLKEKHVIKQKSYMLYDRLHHGT